MPFVELLICFAVSHSPAVPLRAVGGRTWSKKPSFSSYITNRAVRAHRCLCDVSARSTSWVNHCPRMGGADGCSSNPIGGMIQETLGSRPDLQSATKSFGHVGWNAFLCSVEFGFLNALKYGRMLSPVNMTSGLCTGSVRYGSNVGKVL